jgi:hypothetical protein
VPDDWAFSSETPGAGCLREALDGAGWAVALTCPEAEGEGQASAMLAQHNLPIEEGRWYRISFRARGEGIAPEGVSVAIQDTTNWRPLFEYQRFGPGAEWEMVSFEVQATATADQTRFQIWFGGPGTLRLADVAVQPVRPPSEGRWLDGLYLDVPQEWDDPYRFFRW